MDWYLAALRKYATFLGRAQRKEYWYFILFYVLIYIGLFLLDVLTGLYNEDSGVGLLSSLFSLAMFIPSLSVTVRRLHDTDRSGWWLLIALIPLIGGIVLLIFTVMDSQPGENRFGPNPKEVAA